MKPERIIPSWRGNGQARILILPVEQEAATMLVDIDIARTFSFSLQMVRNAPQVAPYLRQAEVDGPRQGTRMAKVITTKGVEGLLSLLRDLNPKSKNLNDHKQAIEWIEKSLLPALRECDESLRVRTVGRGTTTVGRSNNSDWVTRPFPIDLAIKTEFSKFECKLTPFDTLTIIYNGATKICTGPELMKALGLISDQGPNTNSWPALEHPGQPSVWNEVPSVLGMEALPKVCSLAEVCMDGHRANCSFMEGFIPKEGEEGMDEVPFTLSIHAQMRMDSRSVSFKAVKMVLAYGRRVWTRGALVYALEEHEIRHALQRGMDLRSYVGLQVVCSVDRTVLTVYRNYNFKSLKHDQQALTKGGIDDTSKGR